MHGVASPDGLVSLGHALTFDIPSGLQRFHGCLAYLIELAVFFATARVGACAGLAVLGARAVVGHGRFDGEALKSRLRGLLSWQLAGRGLYQLRNYDNK